MPSLLPVSHRKPFSRFSLAAVAVLTCACMPIAGNAQISVDGANGEKVIIGPGGINVQSGNGKGTTVNLSPGGINVQSRRRAAVTGTFNLKAVLAKLEMAAYGKSDDGAPLIVRLEKLEMDNLGKKGTGSNVLRAQAVAKALGVSITSSTGGATAATTSVVTQPARTLVETSTASVQVAPGSLLVTDNHHSGTYMCKSNTVAINSNHCNLVLTGVCKQLLVNGNHNTIKVDRATNINVLGNHNTVLWVQNPTPTIVNMGNENTVARAR